MKLTVYIVDDEPMAVRYLETLLKETSLDPEVAGTAPNGAKAIPEILRLHPDFVFADIDMPVMDGLRMAEEVLRKNPAQKIFMLTAYRDFEYAKKSVRIGVADYIVKNELSAQTLEDLIRRNAAKLEQERRQRHTVMETNLRNFFLSDVPPDEEHGDWALRGGALQRYVLFYAAERPKVVLRRGEQENRGYADCYEIENAMAEPGMICRAFVEISPGEYCGIFSVQEDAGGCEVGQKCRRIAADIVEGLGPDLPNHVCIFSLPVCRIPALQSLYGRLRDRMQYLFAGTKRVYEESETGPRGDSEATQSHDSRAAMWRQALEEGDAEKAEAALDDYLEALKKSCGVWEYTERIRDICRSMETLLREKKLDPHFLDMAPSYADITLLERDLRNSQERYLAELSQRRQKRYSRHIILAQEYIQMNYARDISVADIAEAAGISEGHLRRCFKNEMDVNIVNYLTDYRLNRAKELMRGCRESIEEVWRKTGFTSGQYFSYVFKKKEGITPRDYMRVVNDEESGQQSL